MPALKASTADALASAARQLCYSLDQSQTTDEAFQKLYAAADSRQRATLEQLETLLRSPVSDDKANPTLRLTSYPTLAWLLRQSKTPERSAAALFLEFRRHESFSATAVVAVWSEFAGFLTYLSAVLGVLIVIVVMYGLIILPQFRSLYGGFGQDLPALTHFVFGSRASVFPILLLFAAGLLIFLSWFVFFLRRRLRCYLPLSDFYQKIPLVGSVSLAYNQYLWLSYAGLLRAVGVPSAEALRLAGQRLAIEQFHPWDAPVDESVKRRLWLASTVNSDLAMAARLGRLDDEVQFQREATVDTFLAELSRCRRRTRIIVTIYIYYLVATFVSAMYLPIFSLGSAI